MEYFKTVSIRLFFVLFRKCEVLLLYTAVLFWLLKGNVMNRVFELKNEIKLFLEMKGKPLQTKVLHNLIVHLM